MNIPVIVVLGHGQELLTGAEYLKHLEYLRTSRTDNHEDHLIPRECQTSGTKIVQAHRCRGRGPKEAEPKNVANEGNSAVLHKEESRIAQERTKLS